MSLSTVELSSEGGVGGNQPDSKDECRRMNSSSSFAGGGLLVQMYTLMGEGGFEEDVPPNRELRINWIRNCCPCGPSRVVRQLVKGRGALT